MMLFFSGVGGWKVIVLEKRQEIEASSKVK
jgi:hypothetical protein